MAYSSNPQYRTGRTVYTGDRKDGPTTSSPFYTWTKIVLSFLSLVVIPLIVFAMEHEFHARVTAFATVHKTIMLTKNQCKQSPSLRECLRDMNDGQAIHVVARRNDGGGMYPLNGSVSDNAFNVKISSALQLHRRTEYCQWQETSNEKCDTCQSGNSTSYPCNCRRTYHYVKAWRPIQINSLFFNQPAAHHNPHRVVYPSLSVVSKDMTVDDIDVQPAVLSNSHATLRVNSGTRRRVEWTLDGRPEPTSWFSSWFRWGPPSRIEPLYSLRELRFSEAATREKFMYVGQGGYFFSPYVASQYETAFKYFMEFVEGSLLDFQVGDVIAALTGTCTAGDIRIYYEVDDPQTVSIVGAISKQSRWGSSATALSLGILTTADNYQLGLVHEGDHDVASMFSRESSIIRNWCYFCRLLLLVWSGLGMTLWVWGINNGGSKGFTWLWQGVSVVAVAGGVLSAMWYRLYHQQMYAAIVVLLLCIGLYPLWREIKTGKSQDASVWSRIYQFFEGTRVYPVIYTDDHQKKE